MALSQWEQLEPVPEEPVAVRSREVIKLFEAVELNDVVTTIQSVSVGTKPFRHFLLFLAVDSTGAPTTVQFKVQFRDVAQGPWHTFKQGLFASLFYEDADTASGIWECFLGDVAGRVFRLVAVAVGTSSTLLFTVSASVEFYA